MPAYRSASKRVLDYIEQNKLKRGAKLPAEAELAESLEISRLTLREALNALKQEGIIYSIQGKGTYVAFDYEHITNSLNQNKSMSEMIEASGYVCHTSLFRKQLVKADAEVATGLGVKKDLDVLMCERIRCADDVPVVYSIDYLAPRLASEFLGVMDENVSLYKFVEENCDIELGQCITEISPAITDESLAEKLQIPVNTPVLKFDVLVQDVYCKPLIYAVEYLRADKFKFIINRRR